MTMTDGSQQLNPFRLGVRFAERVWGKADLQPWYSHVGGGPVGEVWLTGEMCVVEEGPYEGKLLAQLEEEFGPSLLGTHPHFPLLVKILFPQQKLSVQVHPDDVQAVTLGGDARPKTECWYVLEAAPGATISLGLKPGTSQGAVQDALGHPSLETLLNEEPVAAGDMIYVEAGTVHAVGAGLVILEVQQPSDTTFRLYDYGRDRELHLEEGLQVIKLETESGKVAQHEGAMCTDLIDVRHFAMSRYTVRGTGALALQTSGGPECIVCLAGFGTLVCDETRIDLRLGHAIAIPASCRGFSVEGECSFVRCRVPEQAA